MTSTKTPPKLVPLHSRTSLDAKPLRWRKDADLRTALDRLAKAWGARLTIQGDD